MHTPVHLERVAQMFLRNYENLKGITADMSKEISKFLAESFANGLWPREIAKNMVELIEKGKMTDIAIKDKLGRTISTKRRASLLARTECIAAHINGAVEECLRMAIKKDKSLQNSLQVMMIEYVMNAQDCICRYLH